MDTQQFGKFIAEQRKAKGYTQKVLAEKLDVTDKAISRWENGHGYPDIVLLEPLAKELGITIVELMQSERIENICEPPQSAEEAISNTIEITISHRKTERTTTLFIYIVSMILLLGLSFLQSIPAYGVIAIAVICIYAAAGVGLLIKSVCVKNKKVNIDSKMFYAVLLVLTALGVLLLLLCSSVSVVR